jgi:hypothetical protein
MKGYKDSLKKSSKSKSCIFCQQKKYIIVDNEIGSTWKGVRDLQEKSPIFAAGF